MAATSNEERLPRLLALVPYLQARPGIEVAQAAADFGVSEEGRLLGHVQIGARMLEARMARLPLDALPEARRLALLHCVLCHHGPDAAPGRRFGSAEALALARINALDASVKGALEHGLPLG